MGFAFTLFCPLAGPEYVGSFALVWFGSVFFFQYNVILDKFEDTASAALPSVCPEVSGTEPKLVPVSSQSSSLAAFVTWICL